MVKHMLYALRPKHWVKNMFIFIPLIFGKKLLSYPENIHAAAGFLIFCFASSTVYLINDITDIKKDKAHPIKRLRPIAAGKISIFQAKLMSLIIGGIALTAGFMFNYDFGILIAAYFIFNLLYSRVLKEIVIIDVFCLAGFFLLRIVVGTVITQVEFSYWMIFMTALLSLFLGFNKRRQELRIFKANSTSHRSVLANYSPYFIDQMISVVTSSIVVIYMFYTVDIRTVHSFGTNHLYYSIPFVYYGVFRYLYLIHKKFSAGDPTTMLFSDRIMQLNILLWVNICIWVIYFGV